MPSKRRIFDIVVRHRIDVQRYARFEAARRLRRLAKEDAKLVGLILGRADNATGEIRGLRARQLMKAAAALRVESIGSLKAEVRDALVAFGQQETATVARMMTAGVGLPVKWNPVELQRMRAAVTQVPFSGGKSNARTLAQWFADMTKADQVRVHGAIQLGIIRGETNETIVRRLAGTAANRYADGVLSITRRRAEGIVRTAVNHVANEAQIAWGAANDDVIVGFEIIAMLDERTCETCEEANGKGVANGEHDLPDGMEENEDGPPPFHLFDRCGLVPVFDLEGLADKVDESALDDSEEAA
jgi:hypothetical protein